LKKRSKKSILSLSALKKEEESDHVSKRAKVFWFFFLKKNILFLWEFNVRYKAFDDVALIEELHRRADALAQDRTGLRTWPEVRAELAARLAGSARRESGGLKPTLRKRRNGDFE
jgi:hypothetical protein